MRYQRKSATPRARARRARLVLGLMLALLAGGGAHSRVVVDEHVIGRSDKYLVVVPRPGDDYAALALRYLRDPARAWQIEDANDSAPLQALDTVVVPLGAPEPGGFYGDSYQTVPILAYHKFGDTPSPMTVTREMFLAQMQYLAEHDYRVVRLRDLPDFLAGRKALPQRAVIITFDDGHQSIYRVAFPVLKRFGFPATLFIYTDYIENGGLKWDQLGEMIDSGLFELQPHSKTHANLAVRWDDESDKRYAERLDQETRLSGQKLREHLVDPLYAFAYPYGDANDQVIDVLRGEGYALGLTVMRGANATFAPPFLLRRNMIFGTRGMAQFREALIVRQQLDAQ